MVDTAKLAIVGVNEGNPKWYSLQRNKDVLNNAVSGVPTGWMNAKCNLAPIFISLEDHKAETLKTRRKGYSEIGLKTIKVMHLPLP